MYTLGLATVFVGYTVAYYGFTQLKGGNWGFLDLVIPSRWTPEIASLARDGSGK